MTENQMRIASLIDHTLLRADATLSQIEELCEQALKYQFASVCVHSGHVDFVARKLRDSTVKTCSVAGFPMGACSTASKVFDAREATDNGAQEIDMVMNIGALKDGRLDFVRDDIALVCRAVHQKSALVKVIIEACLLTDAEKRSACALCEEAGADFVKTSTGLSHGGATAEDVRLMRSVLSPHVEVKAAGGISTLQTLIEMVQAGATRIGTSRAVEIMQVL